MDLGCLLGRLWADDEGANGTGLRGCQIATAIQSTELANLDRHWWITALSFGRICKFLHTIGFNGRESASAKTDLESMGGNPMI